MSSGDAVIGVLLLGAAAGAVACLTLTALLWGAIALVARRTRRREREQQLAAARIFRPAPMGPRTHRVQTRPAAANTSGDDAP